LRAVEQRPTSETFQPGDLSADGALGASQFVIRARRAAESGYGLERF